jgi:hypothetical protein
VTVVTNARAYYHTTRGCGRFGRPAFPAPSDLLGRTLTQNSREMRGEIAKLYLTVIASEAKQSTLALLLPHGLLRFARNDGVGTVVAV